MPLRTRMLTRLRRADAGASAVEYALLVAAIAIIMVTGAFMLGGALDGRFGDSASCVNGNAIAGC